MNSLQSIQCIGFHNGVSIPVVAQTSTPTGVGVISSTTNQILVSFTGCSATAPATSIVLYTVRAYDGASYYYGTGTSSPISVTGLTSSKSYTLTVSAKNNTGGISAYSSSSATTYTLHPHAGWSILATSGSQIYTANGYTVASTSAGEMSTNGNYIDRSAGILLSDSTFTTYGNFINMTPSDFRSACTLYIRFSFGPYSYNQSNARAFTFCQAYNSGVQYFFNAAIQDTTHWQLAYYEGTTKEFDTNVPTYTTTANYIYDVYFTNNGSGSQTFNIYHNGSACITQLTTSVGNSSLFNAYAQFFLARDMFSGTGNQVCFYYANILPYVVTTTQMSNFSAQTAIP